MVKQDEYLLCGEHRDKATTGASMTGSFNVFMAGSSDQSAHLTLSKARMFSLCLDSSSE